MLSIKVKNARQQQYELAYVIYMIVGSYFKECDFAGPVKERCYLYYQEMKADKQVRLENDIDRDFQILAGDILDELQEMKCSLTLSYDGIRLGLHFETGFEEFHYSILPNGEFKSYRMNG